MLNNVRKKLDSMRNTCPKAGHLKIQRGIRIWKGYLANRLVQQAGSQKLYAELLLHFLSVNNS